MKLKNVEFIILQITYEREAVSGYEIDRWIKEQGYREWTDIGTTSVYVGLAKLGEKRLVSSYLDTAQYGRGPLLRNFSITAAGKNVLKQEILAALSSARERDYRFDLAFAAISLVAVEEAVAALEQRKTFLRELAERVNRLFEAQGGPALPFNLQALFKHPLLYIQSEIAFVNSLIEELSIFTGK